jgi:beta-fructofuranosidase
MKKKAPVPSEIGTKATRREFLSSAAACAAMSTLPIKLSAQAMEAPESKLASDPMRPQFHLLPAHNWMNDPNGPIYFHGSYHMFFQYNPKAAVWGDMSWYHSVSPDMIHWKHLPVAMTPTPGSVDSFGCFSGSAIQVGKRVYAVYTGTQMSGDDKATIRDGANNIQEMQCLAWSDDPRLIKWTKDPQPIIPMPPEGMKITGFRDPSAWKQGDAYYMTVGAGEARVGGCVLLYKSKDLKQWEYLHKLTSGEWNGKHTSNPCDDGEMWECPELFPLDGGHVLIYSTLGKVFWQSGRLDTAAMTFKAMKTGELDLGGFYAPKTQLDADGRRILWGWIQEKRSEEAMRAAGWSGMMSLPRVLNLDKDGTLRIKALPDATKLRGVALPQLESYTGTLKILPKASGEAFCTGRKAEHMEFSMNDGKTELLKIAYSPSTRSFALDGKEFKLDASDIPTIHAFVDGSVIEVILSSRIGYTKRFYYSSSTAPDVQVYVDQSDPVTLDAWTITPISPNRLTTPARTV